MSTADLKQSLIAAGVSTARPSDTPAPAPSDELAQLRAELAEMKRQLAESKKTAPKAPAFDKAFCEKAGYTYLVELAKGILLVHEKTYGFGVWKPEEKTGQKGKKYWTRPAFHTRETWGTMFSVWKPLGIALEEIVKAK